MTLLEFIERRFEDMKSGAILTKSGGRYAESSISKQKGVRNHLQDFFNKYGVDDVEKMDDDWFMKYTSYLTRIGLRRNTIHSIVRHTKTVTRKYCKVHKIPLAVEEFSYSAEITTKVYNSVQEIDKILALKLGKTKLGYVRDAYVIQCYIGLRRGDFFLLLADPKRYIIEENGQKFFRILTQKSKKTVVIPIGKRVLDILERRNYNFKHCTIQNYNARLKTLAKKAGLVQEIEVNYTKFGLVQRELIPKWKLISSHTARRSFATNAYLAGIPTLKIRQITGHTNESTFLIYIRAEGLESALTIHDHPFFN